MTRLSKLLILAAAGVLAASSCPALERLPAAQSSDELRTELFDRQDQKHRRREAANARAQRSICEAGCRDKGRPQRTQPPDPFAQLPNWDDPPAEGEAPEE